MRTGPKSLPTADSEANYGSSPSQPANLSTEDKRRESMPYSFSPFKPVLKGMAMSSENAPLFAVGTRRFRLMFDFNLPDSFSTFNQS